MKVHTSSFKDNIKVFGRELDSIITYEEDGEDIILGNDNINSVSYHYEGAILKSVMKQLDIDSNVEISVGTEINYQFGIKVRYADVEDYRDNYDYIDYGNYIVYKVEKQEDMSSYKITCYDKMLYSMKDYVDMNIIYPITIRNYINAICTHLNITFANSNDTFANYNRQIPYELYLDGGGNSLNYTFRDVLDELAQATASTICINADDELEIRYITDSEDTIDEEYLKDVNVNFGEKYGPVNSIVLSRSAESDNVYLKDDTSIANDGLCEIKIVDNQIMNRNDRSDYLPDIFAKLGGLEYYLNDFSSTGICYYDLCDKYTINIGEEYYSCVMLNDEVNITQGLEESVYTEMPEEGETDYTKADKTDRKINQTYLIVDKQNQTIESMVSTVDEQNTKIAHITQTVDELNSKISDVTDLTISGETNSATLNLSGINASEPIQLVVHPVSSPGITYEYPRSNLYPSILNEMLIRKIRFHNNTTNEDFDYVLPDDLLYYNSSNYDEFTLDYGDGTAQTQVCKVVKKCEYNSTGQVVLKSTPVTTNYTYPSINLTNGDYTISILSYAQGYLFTRLMSQNIYTTQFYTKSETNSIINQTASSITLGVSQTLSNYSTTSEMNSAITIKANEINSVVSTKVGNNEVISKINQSAEAITINANKLNLSGYVTVSDLSGSGTTTINGSNITTGTINGNNVNVTNINASNITSGSLNANRISGGTINGNNVSVTNLNASNITTGTLNGRAITNGSITGATYKYSGSDSTITINNNDNGAIYLYRGSSLTNANMRCALNTLTAGGRLTCWGSSGTSGSYAWFNQSGAHTSSDIRYKKHIENIKEKESINIVTNLTPITYDYDDNSYHRGLSAQEVEKVLKNNNIENQIYEIEKNDIYSLNYTELIPDLINCIKYQQAQIENLQQRIEKLERESDK